jgi:hypothetical protein
MLTTLCTPIEKFIIKKTIWIAAYLWTRINILIYVHPIYIPEWILLHEAARVGVVGAVAVVHGLELVFTAAIPIQGVQPPPGEGVGVADGTGRTRGVASRHDRYITIRIILIPLSPRQTSVWT